MGRVSPQFPETRDERHAMPLNSGLLRAVAYVALLSTMGCQSGTPGTTAAVPAGSAAVAPPMSPPNNLISQASYQYNVPVPSQTQPGPPLEKRAPADRMDAPSPNGWHEPEHHGYSD